MFVFKKDGFFKAIKLRECIGNDVAFTKDKMNVRVKLFNVVEPANDAVRSSIVGSDVEVVSMDMKYCF